MAASKFPRWLLRWVWRALIGEIYPQIRAIAASFSHDRELTILYYLDREPTDWDRESVGMVMSYVLAETSNNEQIRTIKEECFFADGPIGTLDPLDIIVYARREYDLEHQPGPDAQPGA